MFNSTENSFYLKWKSVNDKNSEFKVTYQIKCDQTIFPETTDNPYKVSFLDSDSYFKVRVRAIFWADGADKKLSETGDWSAEILAITAKSMHNFAILKL